MWCGFGKSSVTVATLCLITSGVVISDTAFGVRQRNYTPQEFRALLRGLGYNIKVSNTPLTDTETKKVIQEFQKGYKIQPQDGIAGLKTQDFAANIVEILQANLNLVVKPNPLLPRNQYYGSQTEAAVRQYQKKLNSKETGIANLALRQRLDKEAKDILKTPTAAPTTTTPSPAPTATPTTKPTPTTTPRALPTQTPTTTPEALPTATPTTTLEALPTATPTSTP